MVSPRLGFWVAGTVLGLVLGGFLRPVLGGGAVILAALAGTFLVGLIGELANAARTLSSACPRTIPPPGALPADGQVELLPLLGAEREPNRRDPRFFAFRSLEPGGPLEVQPLAGRRVSPPLLGRIALVSVFLGRDGRSWSDGEIAQAHAAMVRAGEWIEREATRWAAPVNVALADTYFSVDDDADAEPVEMSFVPEGEGVAPLEAGAVTKALVDSSRAASKLGFRDAADWMARIRPRLSADALVWLLHPRCAGRSLAIPLDQTELAGVSLAVCYAREASFPEPLSGPPFTDPVTIVHELLHLFGASDKYGLPLHRFPPRSVSSRDIMRLSETRLPRLRIDPRTASEIGWPSTPSQG